jgi:uncharacterized membrane protein HdeD (DUF308 family)
MLSEVPIIARNWWLFVVTGLICIGAAIAVIVWPDITLLAFGVIIGIYLLLAAVMEVVDAVTGEPGGRAVSAILGVIALIAGIICIRVVRAFDVKEGRGWALLIAVIDVAVGCLLLAWPDLGLATAAIIFAATMLIRGLFAIVVGFKLRGLRNEEEPPPVHASLVT